MAAIEDELEATESAPPVVAVVVAHDPGDAFEACLASLADQDYPELSVLVIDAGNEESLVARVAATMPSAFVRRIEGNPGFGPAANEVLGTVEGAAFYLLCHDDVALDRGAVRYLVEESFRSNAGIVGPKLVLWDEPGRLLQVGVEADKGGVLVPVVERGELDQEQHDGVRDVFAVPGAATLVRADLFADLGGFDPGIDLFGEDLDLCWRAHVAGARVLVVPSARVRHVEGLASRISVEEAGRRRNRHRIRTVLIAYSRIHLLRVVPQLLVLSVVEVLYAAVTRRRDHVERVVGAWTWNWSRRDEIRRRRAELREVRRWPDREVRVLQAGGSARLRRFVRGELAGTRVVSGLEGLGGELEEMMRSRPRRWAGAAWLIVLLLFVVGARKLLLQDLPVVGGFAPFDDGPLDLARRYASGWQEAGLGSVAAAPTALGLLAVGGVLFLGQMGLLQQVLVLGMVPLGLVGMWRLTRPVGSSNARAVGLLLYGVVPLPWDAIAQASWAGLVVYAAAPWVLASLAAATSELPGDDPPPARSLLRHGLGLGLLVALVAAVVPAFVGLVVVVAGGVIAGSLLAGATRGWSRPLGVAGVAGATAAVLHLPWTASVVGEGSRLLAGVAPVGTAQASMAELLRFEVGPTGVGSLGWAVPAAALVAVLLGQGWRFRWAVRCWSVALIVWVVAWLGAAGHLPLPPPEALLPPGAAALALAGALGVVAFERDLRGYHFGWRQGVALLGAAAVAVSLLPVALGVVDGRWDLAGSDHAESLAFVGEEPGAGDARVLWIGAPNVLPVASFDLGLDVEGGLAPEVEAPAVGWGLTGTDLGSVTDRWPLPAGRAEALLARSVAEAVDGRTDRLGSLLAPFGVRWVVLVERSAPSFATGVQAPLPARLVDAVGRQLDLVAVDSEPSLRVFENLRAGSVRRLLPADTVADPEGGNGTAALVAAGQLPVGTAILGLDAGFDAWSGQIGPGQVFLAAVAADGWELRVDDEQVTRTDALGWANVWTTEGGEATLRHRSSPTRVLVVAAQALAWLAALGYVVLARRRAS